MCFVQGGSFAAMDMENSGFLQQWLVNSVRRMSLTKYSCVEKWLEDLRIMTDTECMCVLQGKSLTKDTTDLVFTAARSTRDSIDTIKGRAHVIGTEFAKLFRKVEKERWKHVKSGSLRLTCQIRSLLHECNGSVGKPSQHFSKQEQLVMEESAKLVQYIESHVDVNGHKPEKAALIQHITDLGQSFSLLVDLSLGALLQTLLQIIRDNASIHDVKASLSNIVSLGLEGEHMCYLITQVGGVKTLFSICQDTSLEFAHSLALRGIATVCCVTESITELESFGGVACLSSILADTSVSESIRSEAAGVIAQVTSPCLEQYQHLPGFIEHLEDLISSLTSLCIEASTHEVFLLGAAALANITFMDSMACDYFLLYNTAGILIEACMLNKAESLFAKDQVATVLANISSLESCTTNIIDNHGVELLVHFLREQPCGAGTEAELAACERVQQKSAIALTRLSKDKDVTDIIIDLNGVPRLVQLCRQPKERNNSDAVLVACLAALRKIHKVTAAQLDTSEDDVKDLIEPRLMDSFLLCSNLDESIV